MGGHAAGEVASEMAVQIVELELQGVASDLDDAVTGRESRGGAPQGEPQHPRPHDHGGRQAGHGHDGVGAPRVADALSHRPGRRLARLSAARRRAEPTDEGSLVRAGAGRRGLPDAGAGAISPVQQRHHPVRGREPGRRTGHLSAAKSASATCSSWPATGSRAWSTTGGCRRCSWSRAEPERKVHPLIREANGRGGLDNITAIVVQVAPDDDASTARTQEIPAPR